METSTDAKITESKTTDVKITDVGETKTVVSIVMDDTEHVLEPRYGKNNKISIADAEEHFRARAKRYEQNAESKMCRFRPNVAAPERPIDLVKAGLVYYEFKSEDGEYRYNKTLKGLFDEMKNNVTVGNILDTELMYTVIPQKTFKIKLIEQRLSNLTEQWEYYRQMLARSIPPQDLFKKDIISFEETDVAWNIYDEYNSWKKRFN